jgi:hypothetical protein
VGRALIARIEPGKVGTVRDPHGIVHGYTALDMTKVARWKFSGLAGVAVENVEIVSLSEPGIVSSPDPHTYFTFCEQIFRDADWADVDSAVAPTCIACLGAFSKGTEFP